ncbi:MAG: DsrE family protein [Candidatus Micrarchaeota archaeon]|nr:DsrE family protein [Candidatus Micrarchaeota archaeon]
MAGTKIAVVIGSNEPEKAWNAFRFANLASGKKDSVKVFLMNSGVECLADTGKFNVKTLSEKFENDGGKVLACGTCIKSRGLGEVCEISNMETFYSLLMESDKTVYF